MNLAALQRVKLIAMLEQSIGSSKEDNLGYDISQPMFDDEPILTHATASCKGLPQVDIWKEDLGARFYTLTGKLTPEDGNFIELTSQEADKLIMAIRRTKGTTE